MNVFHKIVSVVLMLAICLSIVGCSTTKDTEAEAPPPEATQVIAEVPTEAVAETVEPTEPELRHGSLYYWYSERDDAWYTYVDAGTKCKINAEEVGLPENYSDFYATAQLVADYYVSGRTIEIVDWSIVNINTGVNYGKLTSEEIYLMYCFEHNRKIVEADGYPDTIYLSELNESVIYCYKPAEEEIVNYPTIINDLEEEVILYTKHVGCDLLYGAYACPAQCLPEGKSDFISIMFGPEEDYRIMWEHASHDEIMKLVDGELPVSKLQEYGIMSCEMEYYEPFQYIHNDTDEVVSISVTKNYVDEGEPEQLVVTLQPEELVCCNSFNNTFTIEK